MSAMTGSICDSIKLEKKKTDMLILLSNAAVFVGCRKQLILFVTTKAH